MTLDEIIEMARESGFNVRKWGDETLVRTMHSKGYFVVINRELETFAKLIASAASAKEREACAVIAEEWFCGCGRGKCPEGDLRAQDIANSIRARDEA